jgi:hypothetical protein
VVEDDEAGEQRAMVGALLVVEVLEEIRVQRQVLVAIARMLTS